MKRSWLWLVPLLLAAMVGGSFYFDRQAAINDLAEQSPDLILENLPLLLTDPDFKIREETIDTLADLQADTSTFNFTYELELALHDPHQAVRAAAQDALDDL